MNNEEVILKMLKTLVSDVSGIKDDVSGLKDDVSGLKDDVTGLKDDVSTLKAGQAKLEADVASINETVIRIENVHGEKLAALEDGRKLNYQLIKQIDEKVSRHEEIIFRRIK